MKQKRCCTELAYLLGILLLALGTAWMERADFGMSMVVAPAYLVHLKVSQWVPAFTFGVAEYAFQALLLLLLGLVMGRFRKGYLFSFVTAFFYGTVLDLSIALTALLPGEGLALRLLFYLGGMALCALGVAALFHTYIAPEAYELVVKEFAARLGRPVHRVKTVYDCLSCLVGVLLSFLFFGFGHFEGVKLGTVFCALVNGWLIGKAGGWMEAHLIFWDALPLRKYFEA